MTYQPGHIKWDPVTGSVAIRTNFPEQRAAFASMAWIIASISSGVDHAKTIDVESWIDVPIPGSQEVA